MEDPVPPRPPTAEELEERAAEHEAEALRFFAMSEAEPLYAQVARNHQKVAEIDRTRAAALRTGDIRFRLHR